MDSIASRAKRLTYFAFMWLIPTLAAALILSRSFKGHEEGLIREYESLARARLASIAEGIRFDLGFVRNDLLYIAETALLRGALETGAFQKVGADLQTLMTTRGIYDQIRVIDLAGMERLRINFDGTDARMLAEGELQDKSKRYYFIESAPLERGEVFFSPLDLNVEGGVIEQPHKAVLRLATPVFDSVGKKCGLLIFNYLGEGLTHNLGQEVALLNSDGYWLHGGEERDRWSFMRENPRSYADVFPQLWSEVSTRDSGSIEGTERHLTFLTVSIGERDPGRASKGAEGMNSTPEERQWKLILQRDCLDSSGTVAVLRRSFINRLATTAAFFAALAFLVTRRLFDERDSIIRKLQSHERELTEALEHVHQLSGLLPICASCKSIRDAQGSWSRIEAYITNHSEAVFSHGICPDCAKELYPEAMEDL